MDGRASWTRANVINVSWVQVKKTENYEGRVQLSAIYMLPMINWAGEKSIFGNIFDAHTNICKFEQCDVVAQEKPTVQC